MLKLHIYTISEISLQRRSFYLLHAHPNLAVWRGPCFRQSAQLEGVGSRGWNNAQILGVHIFYYLWFHTKRGSSPFCLIRLTYSHLQYLNFKVLYVSHTCFNMHAKLRIANARQKVSTVHLLQDKTEALKATCNMPCNKPSREKCFLSW